VISASAFVGVLAVSLVLVLTPGPNMMYLVSRSLTQGRRAGVISLGGVGVGFLAYLTATNLGWLALNALRPGGSSPFQPAELIADSSSRLFGMGLLTSLLNPKIAVMYLSLIPQFVDPRAGHLLLQGFALGAVQVAVSLTVDLAIVMSAGAIAMFLTRRPVWMRVQRYLMGTVLGVFALKVATDSGRPATP